MSKWIRHLFIIAIVLSLLLHILVAVLVIFLRIPMPGEWHEAPIEVFDAQGKQIADPLLKGNRQVPKKAEHVGVDDNAVTQETVARPRPSRAPAQRVDEEVVGAERRKPQRKQGKAGSKLPFNRDSLYAVDPRLYSMQQPEKLDHNLESPAPKKRSLPQTAVSSSMNVESEAYLSEDYYPDYTYGAHTYLNVLKYPDVEYFVRLKRAFKQTWSPMAYMIGGEPRSSIAVVLAVSVDPGGAMSELFVLRSSGSGAYDQEALRTIRANAPFSAPPERLLKDGLLRMSWTFIVYM